jgi:hypothetical protein
VYTITVILSALADGTYWIRVVDEKTGERAKPQFGPYARSEVFHELVLIGMKDDRADELIAAADANHTAEAHGITPKETVIPELCPFCKQPAEFRNAGRGDIDMDCRNCLIEVTFTRPAAAMECQNSANTLEYIRGWMRLGVSRPVVTSADMWR